MEKPAWVASVRSIFKVLAFTAALIGLGVQLLSGSPFWGVVLMVGGVLYLLFEANVNEWTRREIPGMMRFVVTVLVLCCLVAAYSKPIIKYFNPAPLPPLPAPPPISPKVNLQDVIKYASSRTLVVGFGSSNLPGQPKDASGTAFWVSSTGLAATCTHSIRKPPIPLFVSPYITSKSIPLKGGIGHAFMGGVTLPLVVSEAKGSGDVMILRVPQVAQGFSAPIGDNKDAVHINNYFFALSESLPSVGDRVFFYAAERNVIPTFTPAEGTITRLGAGSATLNLPFRETYCGAPVIDESEKVVGMIVGQDVKSKDSVMMTSIYISDVLKGTHLE
jgi:hypothetical protein